MFPFYPLHQVTTLGQGKATDGGDNSSSCPARLELRLAQKRCLGGCGGYYSRPASHTRHCPVSCDMRVAARAVNPPPPVPGKESPERVAVWRLLSQACVFQMVKLEPGGTESPVVCQVAAGIPETQTSLRTLQHSTANTIKGHLPISYPQ